MSDFKEGVNYGVLDNRVKKNSEDIKSIDDYLNSLRTKQQNLDTKVATIKQKNDDLEKAFDKFERKLDKFSEKQNKNTIAIAIGTAIFTYLLNNGLL